MWRRSASRITRKQALGDIVFIELPEPGRAVAAAEACAVVESVKAASDVYSPLTGHVGATNEGVVTDPSLVNREAMGEGWLFRIEGVSAGEFAGLMDAAAYRALLDQA